MVPVIIALVPAVESVTVHVMVEFDAGAVVMVPVKNDVAEVIADAATELTFPPEYVHAYVTEPEPPVTETV
jgi:hypothetical protein